MAFNQLINKLRLCRNNTTLSLIYRSFYIRKCRSHFVFNVKRKYHISGLSFKMKHPNIENNYAYTVIAPKSIDKAPSQRETIVTNEMEFNSLLDRDWRNSSATDILQAFKNVQDYCQEHNINVSDVRFDHLVDGLIDHCEKLDYNELLDLLTCLSEYPKCESYQSHNFHDIWSCLDDICCWKMTNWNIEQVFSLADVWYRLSLSKYSDFLYDILDRFNKKADKLSKDELVKIFFLFNATRGKAVAFEYEHALQSKIKEMNIDEMAVVALGYFKSRSSIKIQSIVEDMAQEVTNNSSTIHEISLTAIMKIIRSSNPGRLTNQIIIMLDKLCPEIDRLSNVCCIHIALLLTILGLKHERILSKIAGKVIIDIENLRIKDIERVLHVLSMFNFRPKTAPRIFEKAHEELEKDSRSTEINTYPRCLPSALNFLSLEGIYSSKLMNLLMDKNFMKLNFGSKSKHIPRELLSLDYCIDIEYPEYKGNRVDPKMRYKAIRWHVDYLPTEDYNKKSAYNIFFITVFNTVQKIVGKEKFIYANHILPHFPKPVIVVCKNIETGRFVEPVGFEKYILGDIMVPHKDEFLKWYAIIVLSWNNTIRDSVIPLGHPLLKERQLKKIGYNPVRVIWKEFLPLPEDKQQFHIYSKLL